MRKIWFIGLVIFVVLISGCYGPRANLNTTIQQGGAPAGGTPAATVVAPVITPSATATITPIATGTSAAASLTVEIKSFAFNPVTITVPRGTTVIFVNNDTVAHTVTSTTGVFDSGTLDSGKTFSWTFDQPGTFEYSCTIHPSISHGTVIVT